MSKPDHHPLPRHPLATLWPATGKCQSPPDGPPDRMVMGYTAASASAEDLCSALARRSGLSKTRIKQAMNKGAVWLKRRRGRRRRVRRATTRPKPGDRIELYYDAAILDRQPLESECVEDHSIFSVWFKPAGMLTQGTHFGDHCSLLRTVEKAFKQQRRVFPVHRLDREARGLVLIAHDRATAAGLSRRFRHRQITKGYHAVLKGRLKSSPGIHTIRRSLDGKPAITRYRVIHHERAAERTVVAIWIETGRRHQIRRHFEGIGHPLIGDPRYGQGNQDGDGLRLWASSLAFICPQCRQKHHYTRPPSFLENHSLPSNLNDPLKESSP